MKKIMAIIIMCLGLLALVPNVESGESGVLYLKYRGYTLNSAEISNITDNPNVPTLYAKVSNLTDEQYRWVIPFPYFEINSSEIYKMTISLNAQNIYNAGNVSVYGLTNNGGDFRPHNANWTYAGYGDWTNPGGDYYPTALDTQLVDTGVTVEYTWNITNYFNQAKQYGLIFIAENDCNVTLNVCTETIGAHFEIYYMAGSGQSTNLIKDIWNLKGFSGATSKLASTIYSEISNCVALSWKNATSGYWYTYWPLCGILEDEYLQFGDGLFILTTTNTTWNHT